MFGNDPYSMDDSRQETENGQKYIEPEMRPDPDGQEDSERRQNDGKNDAKYAHNWLV